MARRIGVTNWKTKDEALQAHVAARGVVLVKPLSFMNESGRPIGRIASWYKVAPHDLLVVSDDLDLPFGRLRMRAGGGSGGHNGLKSIAEHIGQDFPRLRIGIGRGHDDTIDHVLSNFGITEERELPILLDVAADGILRWLERGRGDAIQYVNGWHAVNVR